MDSELVIVTLVLDTIYLLLYTALALFTAIKYKFKIDLSGKCTMTLFFIVFVMRLGEWMVYTWQG